MAQASDYPVQLSIDYPESSNRLTAFFRLILMIPILILSVVLGAPKFLAPAADAPLYRKVPQVVV